MRLLASHSSSAMPTPLVNQSHSGNNHLNIN